LQRLNVLGKLSLWTALQILGGFLLLMFLFLLIAIERHSGGWSKNRHPRGEGAGGAARVAVGHPNGVRCG
jgi:hypothetical protein